MRVDVQKASVADPYIPRVNNQRCPKMEACRSVQGHNDRMVASEKVDILF